MLLDTALQLRVIPVNILNPKNCRLLHLVKNEEQMAARLTRVKKVSLKSSYTVNLLKTLLNRFVIIYSYLTNYLK